MVNSQQHGLVRNKPGQTNRDGIVSLAGLGSSAQPRAVPWAQPLCPDPRALRGQLAGAGFPVGLDSWGQGLAAQTVSWGTRTFFFSCRIPASAFPRLPVRGPHCQALLSLTIHCARSKRLSPDGESSGTQRRDRGQPPWLPKPVLGADEAVRQSRLELGSAEEAEGS